MGVLQKDPADATYRRILDAVTAIAGCAAGAGNLDLYRNGAGSWR
jgi:hypothetical protein